MKEISEFNISVMKWPYCCGNRPMICVGSETVVPDNTDIPEHLQYKYTYRCEKCGNEVTTAKKYPEVISDISVFDEEL